MIHRRTISLFSPTSKFHLVLFVDYTFRIRQWATPIHRIFVGVLCAWWWNSRIEHEPTARHAWSVSDWHARLYTAVDQCRVKWLTHVCVIDRPTGGWVDKRLQQQQQQQQQLVDQSSDEHWLPVSHSLVNSTTSCRQCRSQCNLG